MYSGFSFEEYTAVFSFENAVKNKWIVMKDYIKHYQKVAWSSFLLPLVEGISINTCRKVLNHSRMALWFTFKLHKCINILKKFIKLTLVLLAFFCILHIYPPFEFQCPNFRIYYCNFAKLKHNFLFHLSLKNHLVGNKYLYFSVVLLGESRTYMLYMW